MPPLDLIFIQLPAEENGAAVHHRVEIDKPYLESLEEHAQLMELPDEPIYRVRQLIDLLRQPAPLGLEVRGIGIEAATLFDALDQRSVRRNDVTNDSPNKRKRAISLLYCEILWHSTHSLLRDGTPETGPNQLPLSARTSTARWLSSVVL